MQNLKNNVNQNVSEKERILKNKSQRRRANHAQLKKKNAQKIWPNKKKKERMAAAEKLEFMTIKEESGLAELNIYMITATVEECEMLKCIWIA